MPEAVQVLLDCSAGRMFVDGMDTLGATPLMCSFFLRSHYLLIIDYLIIADAARDGNVAVVQYLVSKA